MQEVSAVLVLGLCPNEVCSTSVPVQRAMLLHIFEVMGKVLQKPFSQSERHRERMIFHCTGFNALTDRRSWFFPTIPKLHMLIF
jgi:hypothetical protein